ncbi:PilZ domain-containing protein [Jiella pacifica]|uniref:PilZ domain-containing protein n=1 Tax=Jiella pacifica TaxID=2696469 RepID=A0A6N9T3T6_9HYPH|nr:PilZ domain-containing protein [Jiella pacifica]NDW04865.1 PilZ domain-containing protein [Jiella pacifica]
MQGLCDRQPGEDGRLEARRRTRLRPVKLAGLSRRFLDDGMLYDRSRSGARIRRGSDRPLPPRFFVLDEVEMRLSPVVIVWQAGREIGVRFVGGEIQPTRAEIRRLTGRYYALPD